MTCVSIVADTFVQSQRKPSITDDLLENVKNNFNEHGGADGYAGRWILRLSKRPRDLLQETNGSATSDSPTRLP
jgi:hypothetical protein